MKALQNGVKTIANRGRRHRQTNYPRLISLLIEFAFIKRRVNPN